MANIDNNVKTGTLSEVSAIGRVYESGKLMAARGIVIDKKSELNCEELKISTCEITKAGIGGPLIDSNGNFIGMNFYGLEETPYMPKDIILKLLRILIQKGLLLLILPKFLIQTSRTGGPCLSHIGAIRHGMTRWTRTG